MKNVLISDWNSELAFSYNFYHNCIKYARIWVFTDPYSPDLQSRSIIWSRELFSTFKIYFQQSKFASISWDLISSVSCPISKTGVCLKAILVINEQTE